MLTNEEILALDTFTVRNCTATQVQARFGIDADSRFYVLKEQTLAISKLENEKEARISFRSKDFDLDVKLRAIIDDVLYFTLNESSAVCNVKYGDFHYSNGPLKESGAAAGAGMEIRLL